MSPRSQSGPRHEREARGSGVLPGRPCGQPYALAARVELFDGSFHLIASVGDTAHEQQDHGPAAHGVEQCGLIVARFGETNERGDRLLGLRQLAAKYARADQPEHDLQIFGHVAHALT